ncbi:DivIVA domain-containing protein [Luteipulveratus sp. YIM 133132]|uniref:DivIVA domain-containing protein n=1 Tax=Luteipulveratus flavus TaxID=3031728 RepID=A0ABT6C998_9MICO|nr:MULTISPECIES: DivIVA domain-containing protein [unclassified Luteipulveratus]MDE9364371.1 DivIVA domain-containing protein [Luteipulveratus sp. YIM 133132]MDF8265460.1 DivIVA domain-containing protein [Luteipulveratus sp. YIM 133296]
MQWTQEHIARVEGAQFAERRGGYHVLDVDTYLDHVAACMRAGQQIPDPTTLVFPTSPFRPGYDHGKVDALLFVLKEWRDGYTGREPVERERPEDSAPEYPWSQEQQDWVREAAFPRARGSRTGYLETDVDDFLDEVLVAMGHGQELPDVQSARFGRSTRFRAGYDAEAVDLFLDQLEGARPGGTPATQDVTARRIAASRAPRDIDRQAE